MLAAQAWLCRGLLFGEFQLSRDQVRLFIPLKRHFWTELQAGRLPQWWPWEGLGMPIASQPQASLFHPTTMAYAALPFQAAYALQFFVALPFAAHGTWRLGRALGLRSWAAALGAAAYSLGGYFLSNTEFTSTSLAAAALPYVCLGALRLRRATPRPLLLTVAMTLLVLAGDPVLTYLAAAAVLPFVLMRRRPRQWFRSLGGLGAAALTTGLTTAVMLLPLADHFAQSGRSRGVVPLSTFWSFDLNSLLGLFVPSWSTGSEALYRSVWLGWLTLVFALWGVLQKSRFRWGLLAMAVIAMGFAMGQWLPLWKWASALVPGFRALRFPLKCIGPFCLIFALWAGRGAQALVRRFKRPQLAYLALFGVTLELAVGHASLLATDPLPAPSPLASRMAELGVSAEGTRYSWKWRVSDGGVPPWADLFATAAPAAGSLAGLPTSNAYVPGYSLEYRDLKDQFGVWTALTNSSAPVFGTRFLIRNAPVPGALSDGGTEDAGLPLVTDENTGAIAVELPGALPLAYLSTGVRRFRASTVPVAITHEAFRRGDEVALADDAPGPPAREPVVERQPASVSRVGADVVVSATATHPSVLVLNQALYRGVRAFEGDTELPVLRVNHLVTGVEVQPGPHQVRFSFETPGLRTGAAFSAGGLLLLGLLAAWQWRVSRRGRVFRSPSSTAPPQS